MSRLIPPNYLTIRQSVDDIAAALFSGVADRLIVARFREDGFDVADGEAIEAAVSRLWIAVDDRKIQPYVFGPKHPLPLKFPAAMSKEIPLLRDARGGDFNFLRQRKPPYRYLAELLGPDLSMASIVFEATEIARLARTLMRARRRKASSVISEKVGRPSMQMEVQALIREIVERRKWVPTQPLKALTNQVNRCSRLIKPISDDTVERALRCLHSKTGDRRFERKPRSTGRPISVPAATRKSRIWTVEPQTTPGVSNRPEDAALSDPPALLTGI